MASKLSETIYKNLCEIFDDRNYKYSKKDDKLLIEIIMVGEDDPMHFYINVDDVRSLVIFRSFLPFEFKEDKRIAGAIAVCNINYKVCDGTFNTDVRNGSTYFKLTTSYRDSIISKAVLEQMFELSCQMVDKYNDRLAAVNDGTLDPNDIG